MSVAFRVPELGEGVYEAELVEWKVQPGDTVTHGQPLAEVMTDKATMELPSPFAGKITALRIEPGSTFQVGQEILEYEPEGELVEAGSRPQPVAVSAADEGGNGRRRPARAADGRPSVTVRAAPSVRRMARSLGIDLTQVAGSGKGGRILIDDLAEHVRRTAPSTPAKEPASRQLLADVGQAGTTMPLRGLRRKVAEHMVRSVSQIPHYSYVDEVCVTSLTRLYHELSKPLTQQGVRLTYLAFWVQAAVRALKQVPIVNATFDSEKQEIALHDRYDIGIATATRRGLVVPVLRNADQLSILETARQIDRLVSDVRQDRVKPDQLRGSTFTVTSIGNIGGLISTPIINEPEVGIMGVGQIRRRPEYSPSGTIEPADVVYLSFSFDHRIVDGAVAAIFGNAVKDVLERPSLLLV